MIALILALAGPAQAANLDGVDEACWPTAERLQADIAAGKGSYN